MVLGNEDIEVFCVVSTRFRQSLPDKRNMDLSVWQPPLYSCQHSPKEFFVHGIGKISLCHANVRPSYFARL